jgi:rhodanese-related sulfurtransferase
VPELPVGARHAANLDLRCFDVERRAQLGGARGRRVRVRWWLHVRRPLGKDPMRRTVDDLLAEARATIERISPQQAADELEHGALFVDTRPSEQRTAHGAIRGAVSIGLNVLEWRLDPTSESRIAQASGHDVRVIVFCQQGYSSSLAAARLQSLGLHRATDVIGGFEAWKEAGLPVEPTERSRHDA